MTNKRPERNIAKMDVLKDIRGLLSSTQEQEVSKEARAEEKAGSKAETAAAEKEVARYKDLLQKHLDEIDRLKKENKGLLQKQLDEIEKLKTENKALVQKQQQEQDRLRSENKELAAKLDNLASGKSKSVSPGADKVSLEMAQIEARQAELSLALSQVEGLLQVKSQELLRRIARLFQEAGQGEIALELRRSGNELENLENLAHFVRALLGE
ncbi:MAG: hypothetical protein A2Z28_00240 [Chloroflexi bacterium RBG_16_51_9]|nr:MAG: hypothetical protein A2Z28_00240 [Chloroflexi bacterium RBG_16_51_9]